MTITREFTKEQLIARINQVTAINKYRISRDPDADGLAMDNELFAIALASLEAGPVAWISERNLKNLGKSFSVYVKHEPVMVRPIPLFTAPPAPVVPDEMDEAGGVCCEVSYADGWNACRAAMQGKSEPVTTDCKLPSRQHFISLCNQFWNWQEADEINAGEEEPRLEWNGSEFTHRVTQALWRMYQASLGNSPVIPDGWVACSERIPDEDGNYWGWWSESKRQGPVWFIKSDLQAAFQSSEITHWMPLPAAPQQEVKP